jgi:hypothetical protein
MRVELLRKLNLMRKGARIVGTKLVNESGIAQKAEPDEERGS